MGNTSLSRREFLKLLSCVPLGFAKFPDYVPKNLDTDTPTIIAWEASEAAKKFFEGVPYNWDLNAHCSSFASRYLRHLGFPVGPDNQHTFEYVVKPNSAMPESTTPKQVKWLRQLAKNSQARLGFDIPLKKLFSDSEIWSNIRPGSVIYLQEGEAHQGYNTYSHTAVFVGIKSGKFVFAEYAPNMRSGPLNDRTLEELIQMYPYSDQGDFKPYNLGKNTPKELTAYVFDAVAASRFMWRQGGTVLPNSKILEKFGAEVYITVNVNDGTTAIFEKSLEQIPIGESPEGYAVIGRKLKINPDLSALYVSSAFAIDYSYYDGEIGSLVNAQGVPRRTYTPTIISRLKDFIYVSNFGNIGGKTHIAQLVPLVKTRYGIEEQTYNSDYTIHRVPEDTDNQEILLREPNLIRNNTPGPNYGPLKDPYLSSGCINYDRYTWQKIVDIIEPFLEQEKKVVTVFSYPNLDQDLLFTERFDWITDPLGGRQELWKYNDESIRDRIFYEPDPPYVPLLNRTRYNKKYHYR